jgi:glycosyltransferase involved in cell wall biosynthesis
VVQFKDNGVFNQVEVVISDNASTDNTTAIVKEFQNKFANIKYFRNETNLGFDRNILNIIEKSEGEYCLTIGDDDGFFPGSFSYILNKIKTMGAPYYIINSWGYDHELVYPILSHPNMQTDKDILYESLTEYVRTINKKGDLLGAVCGLSHIFHRDEWMNFENKEQYIGTNVIYFHISLSVFKNSRCAILAEPIIKTRSANVRWDEAQGLGSMHERITSTVGLAVWVKNLFHLPISNFNLQFYFYSRGYWFAFKELVKSMLSKLGLGTLIDYYRKIR